MGQKKMYIGVMTGTSLDAIDVSICQFEDKKINLIGTHSTEWPETLHTVLREFAIAENVSLDLLARTHFVLAEYYCRSVNEALEKHHLKKSDIRAIGLHGQTIRHLPQKKSIGVGVPATGATFQLGSGSALAALVGIDVVSDFRSADVAAGGEGAPLVPMFDYYFLKSSTTARFIVNIGGISNVTWIPAASKSEEVIAFDCGPGNMVLDELCRVFLNSPYDKNGTRARRGRVDNTLLNSLLVHPYFSKLPPKSTGRELFGTLFFICFQEKVVSGKLTIEDALATAVELTAISIADSKRFVNTVPGATEWIISGGGALNEFLMERIAALVSPSTVLNSKELGIPVQAKESIAFAFFAKAFIENIFIHLTQTTGASKGLCLGSLSLGNVGSVKPL